MDVTLLVARIALGAIFIYTGYGKLTNIGATSSAFAGWGYPAPMFFAYLVGLVELLGGAAVLLGVYTRFAAKVLSVVMIFALLTVHWRLGEPLMMWALPLALLGGLLAISVSGGGKWKIMKKECCCGSTSGCGCGGSCGTGACDSHADKMKNGDACCGGHDHGEKKMGDMK